MIKLLKDLKIGDVVYRMIEDCDGIEPKIAYITYIDKYKNHYSINVYSKYYEIGNGNKSYSLAYSTFENKFDYEVIATSKEACIKAYKELCYVKIDKLKKNINKFSN